MLTGMDQSDFFLSGRVFRELDFGGDQLDAAIHEAGHPYTVTTAAFLPRDAVRTCRCGNTFPCPAEADEVVCPACRLHQPGPFLDADPGRRDYVDRVHADDMDGVRARLRRLRGEGLSTGGGTAATARTGAPGPARGAPAGTPRRCRREVGRTSGSSRNQ